MRSTGPSALPRSSPDDTGDSDVAPDRSASSVTDRWRSVHALDRMFHGSLLGDDATGAVIAIVDGDTLVLLGTTGDLPPVPLHHPISLPLQRALPLCRSARRTRQIVLATRSELEAASPWLAAFAPTARAAVVSPVRDGDGTIGAYGVTYGDEWRPGSDRTTLATRLDALGLVLGRSVAG